MSLCATLLQPPRHCHRTRHRPLAPATVHLHPPPIASANPPSEANPINSRNGPIMCITLPNLVPTTISPVYSHQNPRLLQR
ncbi:hypothetical protein PtA15_6A69 [Puccinia triticina]|uniref:Uncharacterized protein n=1 Tax=Puccinia triticina TaxID=208348 RepID=A0ABY7CJN1_9BASI|nr:uncharacterized protein PtA15_6A69 [Puccinia triticina]WAQ85441.1 hypothetical protein PtA15_6A69 [Puccinia triticina]